MKINLEIKLPLDPAIPLKDIYPKKMKNSNLIFIAIFFTIAKIGKQTKCPSLDKQIK